MFVKVDALLSFCLENCLSFSGCWTSHVYTVSVWSPFVWSHLSVESTVLSNLYGLCTRRCGPPAPGDRVGPGATGSRVGSCTSCAGALPVYACVLCTAVFSMLHYTVFESLLQILHFYPQNVSLTYRVDNVSLHLLCLIFLTWPGSTVKVLHK